MGSRETSPVPPPGFRPFEWPEVKWIKNGELQRDPGLKFVASWSAKIAEEEMSSPPPLETLSPIPMVTSQDSMTVQVGTTDSEEVTPIVLDRIRSVHRRRPRRPSSLHTTIVKPTPVEDFLFKDILSAFRHTTYKWEDHARPEGGLGVPLNHPRFLEWLGAPDSAWLLEMSPGHWCDTLSRDQAMTAAMQLHRDACIVSCKRT